MPAIGIRFQRSADAIVNVMATANKGASRRHVRAAADIFASGNLRPLAAA
jgi:hypothetical protein